MSRPDHTTTPRSVHPREFATTRWSVIERAGGANDAEARASLEVLCRAYWYPLYAFIRRSGYSPHDSEDLVQGFFASLLERSDLGE